MTRLSGLIRKLIHVPMAVCLAGCVLLPSRTDAPTPIVGPAPVLLPGSGELVPAVASSALGWTGIDPPTQTFDEAAAFTTPADLAAAYAADLEAPTEPAVTYRLTDEDAVLVLTVEAEDGDPARGVQHALALYRRHDGWRLGQVYVRQLCPRGATGEVCADG